jgi:hypothetical protein
MAKEPTLYPWLRGMHDKRSSNIERVPYLSQVVGGRRGIALSDRGEGADTERSASTPCTLSLCLDDAWIRQWAPKDKVVRYNPTLGIT